MKVHAIINRFSGTPDDFGIPQASYVHHYHLHQPGEPIDAEIAEPDPWGKGPYVVNFDGLLERVAALTAPYPEQRPLVLEMEVGGQVFGIRNGRDAEALQHIGKVVGALGGVDCVYGNAWDEQETPQERDILADVAAYAMIGCPDRLAISAYGRWDHHWAPTVAGRIYRAQRTAGLIQWKDVRPVLFISPFVAREGDMTREEWEALCKAARKVAGGFGSDLMIWWDGGRDRRPYAEAEPYIDTAREVLL